MHFYTIYVQLQYIQYHAIVFLCCKTVFRFNIVKDLFLTSITLKRTNVVYSGNSNQSLKFFSTTI